MRSRLQGFIVIAVVLPAVFLMTALPVPAPAQNQQAPKILLPKAGPPPPRLPDGHVDLGNGKGSWSPVVIKDLTGHGYGDTNFENFGKTRLQLVEKVVDIQMLPWAQKFFEAADRSLSKDDPEGFCLPPGIPRLQATPFLFQIYQLPDRLMFVYEGGAHMWRIVYTDGRGHTPAADNPTYLGDSIGHWEKDTMVVDNIGFNNKTWLDAAGHPHSEKLHVVERYTRTSVNNLHYEATIDDPGAYTKPWTTSWNIVWEPGVTPLEYICQENERDTRHLVGK